MKTIRAERARMREEMSCTVESNLNLPSKMLTGKRGAPVGGTGVPGMKPAQQRTIQLPDHHAPIGSEKLLSKFAYHPCLPTASVPRNHIGGDPTTPAPGGIVLQPIASPTGATPPPPPGGVLSPHARGRAASPISLKASDGGNSHAPRSTAPGKLEPLTAASANVLVRGTLEEIFGHVQHNMADKHAPAWHTISETTGVSERLPDSTSKLLEEAYQAGRGESQVPVCGPHGGVVGVEQVDLVAMRTQRGAALVRDEFSSIDFHGRRFRTKQEECEARRQEQLAKRKELLFRTPAHCHIYHNPVIAELTQTGQFPMQEVQKATRTKAGFVSGTRHITGDVVPTLEESLPMCVMRSPASGGVAREGGRPVRTPKLVTVGGVLFDSPTPTTPVSEPLVPLVDPPPAGGIDAEDETAQLLANDFAGIHSIIAQLPPDELPKLRVASGATRFDTEGVAEGGGVGGVGGALSPSYRRAGGGGGVGYRRRDQSPVVALNDPNCTACKVYMSRAEESASPTCMSSVNYEAKSQEWRNLTYSSKLHMSNVLKETIAMREMTKEYVAKSPAFLAELARLAEGQAKRWADTRYTGPPLKAVRSAGPPSIWQNATNQLCSERAESYQCIVAYARLMYYCEKIGAPCSEKQLELIHSYRALLIEKRRVDRQLFFDLLQREGPRVILSRTNMLVLHFIRIELGIPLTPLFKFVKKSKNAGWVLPRDLAAIQERKVAGDSADQ